MFDMKNKKSEVNENTVSFYIWRESEFLGGLYRHMTNREKFRIGHVAVRTYRRKNPQFEKDGQEYLEGRFLNFLPPPEETIVLGMLVSKTNNQAISSDCIENAEEFLELDPPSAVIHLNHLNATAIENTYDLLRANSEHIQWTAWTGLFFSSNNMSSTKIALQLLTSGIAGGLDLPMHIKIPTLRHVNHLIQRLKKLAETERSIKDILDKTSIADALKILVGLPVSETVEFAKSLINTITTLTAVTASECEEALNYIKQVELATELDQQESLSDAVDEVDSVPDEQVPSVQPVF